MNESINIVPKVKKDEYELDDNDYLLIKAIEELTQAIRRLKLNG